MKTKRDAPVWGGSLAKWGAKRVMGATVASVVLVATAALAGSVTYVYDELGRLAGVRDESSGQAATYTYDPAGNLTAIAVNSTVVTVVSFTPTCGAQGTTVVIAGSGFAPTPGGNAVAFNGQLATVTQASATRLVVTVPAGDTAGPIFVTAGGSSGTSPTAFGGACGPPTITGFSPTSGTAASSGVAGTTVTVTGTNFQARPTDNVVTFGVSRAVVTAGSTTSITTSVPEGAASGRISIATPYGQARSAQDFLVVPDGHAPSDVDTSVRTTVGQNTTVAIRAAAHIGMILFDGTEGERISILATPSGGPWRLQLLGPYGAIDASNPPCGSSQMYLRPTTLPLTATYAIEVDDPAGLATGSPTVTIYDVADTTQPTFGNAIVQVTTSTPGQRTNLPFTSFPGRRLSALVTPTAFSCPVSSGCNAYASIIGPDGGFLHDPVRVDGRGFLDTRTVSLVGLHTLLFDPGPNTGTVNIQLFRLTKDRIKRWRIGSHAAFRARRPGTNIHLTFSGLVGQQVGIQRSNETFPVGMADLSIVNPDGSALVPPTPGNVGPITLPQSGTYIVMFDPIGAALGSVNLTLTDCSAGPC